LKVIVIDGQGGKIGRLLVEQLIENFPGIEIICIGTNSIATSNMLKAGSVLGATGENPVIFNCKDADIILGPIGIIISQSFLGEITPDMARAISESRARKILIPFTKCNTTVVSTQEMSYGQYAKLAIEEVKMIIEKYV